MVLRAVDVSAGVDTARLPDCRPTERADGSVAPVSTRGALVAGSALIVLACGCSSGSGKTAHHDGQAAGVDVDATANHVCAEDDHDVFAPLAPLVLKNAPSGYPRRADSLADTGPTDLEKAVLEDPLNDPKDARQTLRAAGFLRGYQRQWSTGDTIGQNFIFVYQFATPAGALSYLSHWRTAVIADVSGAPPVPFTPLVPGAIGLESRSGRASIRCDPVRRRGSTRSRPWPRADPDWTLGLRRILWRSRSTRFFPDVPVACDNDRLRSGREG